MIVFHCMFPYVGKVRRREKVCEKERLGGREGVKCVKRKEKKTQEKRIDNLTKRNKNERKEVK